MEPTDNAIKSRIPRFIDDIKRLRYIQAIAGIKPPFRSKRLLYFLLSIAATILITYIVSHNTDMPREMLFMLGIFIMAALLWITEALPLFATAISVIAAEIILLANPGDWQGFGFGTGESPDYRLFLEPLANPVIVLFFGGFLLAHAVLKEGVDKAMAAGILHLFGGRPVMVLLGLMSITGVFSMWMSNTATTCMMITLVVPMIRNIPKGDPFRKGLLLCIPVAANIGGMGTPIASPPNAVAITYLNQAGYNITFLQWVLIAVPFMAGMLIFSWMVLYFLFKPHDPKLQLTTEKRTIDRRGWYVIGVLVLTIGLWLTDSLHGLSTAVVALVPAVAFTATGLLSRSDINSLEWHILILIMGGIALGLGMQITGLDQTFVSFVPEEAGYAFIALIIITLLMSTFISNTAAANLILPIGIAFAASNIGGEFAAVQLALGIALSSSLAMSLPVSTPPNTIAYSQGNLHTRDFLLSGLIIGGFAILLIIVMGKPIINFWLNF